MTRLFNFLFILGSLYSTNFVQPVSNTVCKTEQIGQSGLVSGIDAEITSTSPVKLYTNPSTDSKLVAQLPPNTLVYIGSKPQCDKDHIWWQVTFDIGSSNPSTNFGWISELEDGTPQLTSHIPMLNPTLPQQAVSITATNLSKLASQTEMGPLGDVLQFVWSPNSEYLAINTLHAVWVYYINSTKPNIAPTRLPAVATTFWNEIGSVAFSPDSQSIATVDATNGDFHFWSLDGKERNIVKTGTTDYAGVAAIAPDLSKWAIAHLDGNITIWDVQSGMKMQILQGHKLVGSLAFTPDGNTLISMGGFPYADASDEYKDNSVRLWNVTTGKSLAILEVKKPQMAGAKSRITISPDGKSAAIFAALDKRDNSYPFAIYMIDIPSASIQNQYELPGDTTIGNMSFSRDGNILSINILTAITFMDSTTGNIMAQLPLEQPIQTLEISPDGRWLVLAHEDDNFNKSIIQFWGTY